MWKRLYAAICVRRTKPQSFPRKRESTSQTFENLLRIDWISAFRE